MSNLSELTNQVSYWNNKFISFWHDPIDKALRIKDHEERSTKFLEAFGLQKPNEKYWGIADSIAASFERQYLPSYNADPKKSGAIDFINSCIIKHPISPNELKFDLNKFFENKNLDEVFNEILEFIKKDIGVKEGGGGYSDNFKGDEFGFSKAKFLYSLLFLRAKLAYEDVGGLGSLWYRLPADTRFPDHSIWQHNALTSAIYSCIELSNSDSDFLNKISKDEKRIITNEEDSYNKNISSISLMVFSINPVQDYIFKARKLRDYWTGSVIVSWLAFEGLRWVIENLGPDHIIYPSLFDQPLINKYLKENFKIDSSIDHILCKETEIATLPNKFLILIPTKFAQNIGESIKNHINEQWNYFISLSLKRIIKKVGDVNEIKELFNKQNDNLWTFTWSTSVLINTNILKDVSKMVESNQTKNIIEIIDSLNEISKYNEGNIGKFYSLSHSLVQTIHSISKATNVYNRKEEHGVKCDLCHERESLFINSNNKDYEKVWKIFIDEDIKENEKLCSVCFTKRVAYKLLKDENHILNSTFSYKKKFPNTTYIAMNDYFIRNKITDKEKKIDLSNKFFESDDDFLMGENKLENSDKYYSILMMDGDKIGELISGTSIKANFSDILHPEIVTKIKNNCFEAKFVESWNNILYKKRLITPSVHLAISEALADFSIAGVKNIIASNDGKLIYAGGDDVCAILPTKKAIKVAQEIKNYFNSYFKLINFDNEEQEINSNNIVKGKLFIGMGSAISISAAILICHHKDNLTEMIQRCSKLLKNKAKEECGRNSLAVELNKRSGGSRSFVAKWDDNEYWDSFNNLSIKFESKYKISKSLAYKIEKFVDGLIPLSSNKDNFNKFILSLIDGSVLYNKDNSLKKEIAQSVTNLIFPKNNSNNISYESLVIASFISSGEV